MRPPRALDRRIARLEALAPRLPDPPPDPGDPTALLPWALNSELVWLEAQPNDDALCEAFVALHPQLLSRRATGMTSEDIRRHSEECECSYFDPAAGRHRRVAPHPIDATKWIDVFDATEGLI